MKKQRTGKQKRKKAGKKTEKQNKQARKYLIPSLKGPLATGWQYIKDSRNYIYFTIITFVFFALIGFFNAKDFSYLDKLLAEIVQNTKNLQGMDLISFIFQNNLNMAFVSLFLGIILGIFPLISIMSNGVIIGYVISKVSSIAGFSEIWRLFPHGIFELPAIFISLGLGIRLGAFIFKKNRMQTLIERAYKSLLVFFLIIIPLLIIAAVIEGLLITLLK
ncbi:stage II sporulation protein M [Candidatus Pacearchaeota archaeon]|nr:stage II sporulation protein M [Candidatus Pacearchaeota archaeon]